MIGDAAEAKVMDIFELISFLNDRNAVMRFECSKSDPFEEIVGVGLSETNLNKDYTLG